MSSNDGGSIRQHEGLIRLDHPLRRRFTVGQRRLAWLLALLALAGVLSVVLVARWAGHSAEATYQHRQATATQVTGRVVAPNSDQATAGSQQATAGLTAGAGEATVGNPPNFLVWHAAGKDFRTPYNAPVGTKDHIWVDGSGHRLADFDPHHSPATSVAVIAAVEGAIMLTLVVGLGVGGLLRLRWKHALSCWDRDWERFCSA